MVGYSLVPNDDDGLLQPATSRATLPPSETAKMKIELIRIALTFLSSLAGLCIALMLLNRRLILMPDSRLKGPAILLVLIVIIGVFGIAGLILPLVPWVFVPIGILLLVFAGELRRTFLRRLYAGARPLNTIPHKVNYRRPFTTTDIETHQYSIVLNDWHGPSFRIAHLSDFHVNQMFPIEYYVQAFDLAEQTGSDFVFLTGDYVTKLYATTSLAQILRPVGKRGTFAVLGNHDYWAGADDVKAAIRRSGITLLTDESVLEDINGEKIQISGCDFPWSKKKCSIPKFGNGAIRLVLSHTPDNIYQLSEESVHCVFSGHYHAGQLRVPLLGSIVVPSVYGRRFDHGHFIVKGTHLFVVSGVGAANPPFRIYCRPDIFVVDVNGWMEEKKPPNSE